MVKTVIVFLVVCCVFLNANAQPGMPGKVTANTFEQGHLRISLITCGPGNDIWEVFGHSCIRVTDSARNDAYRDVVFNYGALNYDPANFYGRLLKGTLPYYLGVMPFNAFRKMFEERRRSMFEEELLLDVQQKKDMVAFLSKNAMPENREYKYDFLTNNCSTCIRDVFRKVYGDKFVFGNALPSTYVATYRGVSEAYAYRKPMERFGLYIFVGSSTDRPIDSMEVLFIPDYLRKAVKNATINGLKVAGPSVQLLPGYDRVPDKINFPLLCCSIIALLVIAGLSVKKLHTFGKLMSISVLVVTGIAGCLVLFFWFGTDHYCTQDNYNFLWACPLNIIAPALSNKWKARYSILAILLIFVTILLHVLRIQFITLFELLPLLLALLYIHGMNYRTATSNVEK